MAEMDEATSTSPLPSPPPLESDEISVFFHNIHRSCRSPLLPDSEQHRVKNGTSAFATESSYSKRRNLLAAESDLDDFDSKSEVFKEEEGFDAWKEPSNRAPSRASKRRSRAAEVHNLSEKRRRSRINEKMKALQSLIPNSNKTDKASMLDEVIEYLKQLQLQVQMLSMRNGLGLHPTYLPGGLEPLHLPQVQMGFNEGNGMLEHMNMGTGALPSMTNITIPDTSYGLDSQIQVHQRPFQLYTTSEEIYREEILPQQQLHIHHSRNPSEHMETSEDMLPKNSDNNRILIQQLHSYKLTVHRQEEV